MDIRPMHPAFASPSPAAIPILLVTTSALEQALKSLPPAARHFAKAADFSAKAGKLLLVPDGDGKITHVLFGIEDASDPARDPFRAGQLPALLPPGTYRFADGAGDTRLAALAFALGTYRFARYRKAETPPAKLAIADATDISRMADAVAMARDLINTPSNDMGPEELEAAARSLAQRFGATVESIVGDDLLQKNFPLVHAVGRASPRAPRLIDLNWGNASHPKITLVGKGVCFDTGGLDLKPSSSMLMMKKDMGGAASVLALAQMIMDAKLKIRLRVLIPAVENSVAGNAFRPLDVYPSRKGITVEIGNTDAEGRLVLADALTYACEDKPDLLVDFGTLTGAARVALGPELPPFYTKDDTLAADVARVAMAENDPLWRMPLWAPYDSWLDGKTATLNNVSSGGFAGSIVCALFLQRFVEPQTKWLHADIYAWSSGKPGRPEGAECQAARALYRLLAERHG
jgi:leucyl aminopeptidase